MGKSLKLNLPVVVVGCDLRSLMFAFYHNYAYVAVGEVPEGPMYAYDEVPLLNCFKEVLRTDKGDVLFLETDKLRNFIILCMCLSGKLIGRKFYSVKKTEEGLTVITKSNQAIKIKSDRIIVFDNVLIKNADYKIVEESAVLVDDYKILCGGAHQRVIGSDAFPTMISFDGASARCLSQVGKKDTDNFDYSPVSLKYKLENMLAEKEVPFHKERKSYKIDFVKREIFFLQKVKYNDEDILCNEETIGEICWKYKTLSISQDAYPWSLARALLDSSGMTL